MNLQNIKNKYMNFSYIYPIYTALTLGSLFFTELSIADTLFWASIASLLIAFFTGKQSRLRLTKMFRFADFRFRGVDKHVQEILDPAYDGEIKKDTDKFYGSISTSSLVFGLITFILCAILSFI